LLIDDKEFRPDLFIYSQKVELFAVCSQNSFIILKGLLKKNFFYKILNLKIFEKFLSAKNLRTIFADFKNNFPGYCTSST